MECHYCGELDSVDSYTSCCYQAICQECEKYLGQVCSDCSGRDIELRKFQVDSITVESDTTTSVQLKTAQADLNQSKIAMEDFFTSTKTLPWVLPVSRQAHYQAEIKNLSLQHDYLTRINSFVTYGHHVAEIPDYSFTPPGFVVKVLHQRTKLYQEVVVDESYLTFIRHNLDKAWHWYSVSSNSNVTPDLIVKYPQLAWNCCGLAANPNFTLNQVESSLRLIASVHEIEEPSLVDVLPDYSKNPNLTLAELNAYPDSVWNWAEVSRNPAMSLKIILANLTKPWDAFYLAQNPNITLTDILNYPQLGIASTDPTDWMAWLGFCLNPNLDLAFMTANTHLSWSWFNIAANPATKLDDILSQPDRDWNWAQVSSNINVGLVEVLNQPDLAWNWAYLSQNSAITVAEVENQPELAWVWSRLSGNSNFTFREVERYGDKEWNYRLLSSNPMATVK